MCARTKRVDPLTSVDPAGRYSKECVEIQGVVSWYGQVRWPHDNYAMYSFSFAAWRVIGQRLQKRRLTLLRPIGRRADPYDDFPACTLHRLRVLLALDGDFAIVAGDPTKVESDTALSAFAERLKQPVVLRGKHFGELVLNRGIDCFEGSPKWGRLPVRLTLDADSGPAKQARCRAAFAFEEQLLA